MNMRIKEFAKEVGNYLNEVSNGEVSFKDCEKPTITLNGEPREVESVAISKYGDMIGISLIPNGKGGEIGIDITTNELEAEISVEELEKELAEMGIGELLATMYPKVK